MPTPGRVSRRAPEGPVAGVPCTSIIDQLKHLGQRSGCYKVILDCAEKNVGFYEKLGFLRKEIQMALYFASG